MKTVPVSATFATKLKAAEADGTITMPEVSNLRKTAIREVDKKTGGTRLEKTQAYAKAISGLSGTPKNKAAGNFLKVVKEEMTARIEAEKLSAKLVDFFSKHGDRVPKSLAKEINFKDPNAFRVSAGGGQGTGHRTLSLETDSYHAKYGTAKALMDFLAKQPELKSVASKLKASQWGSVDLWLRSTLDKDALGWSTESVADGFRQAQTRASDGGEQIAMGELGDIVQALANVGILSIFDDPAAEKAEKVVMKEFGAEVKKAWEAGHVNDAVRDDYNKWFADLYNIPKLPTT